MIYVITFDPTKIFIDWAHQNDPQNLIFVKAINVVVKKMARNGRTMANSYHCGLFARPVFRLGQKNQKPDFLIEWPPNMMKSIL